VCSRVNKGHSYVKYIHLIYYYTNNNSTILIIMIIIRIIIIIIINKKIQMKNTIRNIESKV
jgi:hypothetical protein